MNSFRLPIFTTLRSATNILIAGAGGGFDVFSGLPFYFNLVAAGKRVFLANLSFSNLPPKTAGRAITPCCVEVTADSVGSENFFPEKRLCEWFAGQGKKISVYCFHRVGPKPLHEAYRALVEMHQIDTIILADGGTDSLMRGDEEGLGTPVEDMSSICAVDRLKIPRKLLVCLGFGVDAFHGICHAHVLEAVAELSKAGGYLGAFSLLPDMPEVQKYAEATEYVLKKTPGRESIVCSSVLSALEGRFGDFHRFGRTIGSELFINPLMSLYWCFNLEQVARRVMYLEQIAWMDSFLAVEGCIANAHDSYRIAWRRKRDLPM